MRIITDQLFIGNPFYEGGHYSYDWQHLMGVYKSIVKKDMTVLEIGSSNFQKTRELSRYCKKLIGIEIDINKVFTPVGNIEILNADWQNLSSILGDNSIDIVISSHVLEHVPDDLRAINESYRVLKKGGQLLFITPNKQRLTRYIGKLLHFENKFIYDEHIREYTEEDVKRLILNSKFTNYVIGAVVFGLHVGKFMVYLKECPRRLKKFANFLEVQLIK